MITRSFNSTLASTPSNPLRICVSTTVSNKPFSYSCSVSPIQRMILSAGWSKHLCRTSLICSSVSPKRVRRSECPSNTYEHPAEAIMLGAISPVNAPFSFAPTFWAPTCIPDPSSTCTASAMYGRGGKMTASGELMLDMASRWLMKLAARSFRRVIASPRVAGLSFQLPATIGRRSFAEDEVTAAAEEEDASLPLFQEPIP
mmetsp:Transcript_20126/g.42317  ORF Transcript_20126/g.42317 Transcript_20126/m.42317 type:complete len:201 (+) Transcript_20126:54-656(+)